MSIVSKRLFVEASQIITDDPNSPGDVLAAKDSGEGFGPVSVIDVLNESGLVFVLCGAAYIPIVTIDGSDCVQWVSKVV